MRHYVPLLLLPALLTTGISLAAGKEEAPRAARSVHLWYPAPDATVFYNEAIVEESHPGTYFAACGFAHGYLGIQELGNRRKVVIFSVWDPGKQDNPSALPPEKRVELLAKGEGVRTGRFGGEGTGGQSFYDYPWKVGERCRFLIKAAPEGDRTTFAAYFYLSGPGRWQHLATFRTLTGGKPLKGYYSFVEDFRRDGKSAGEVHRARYGNGWVRTLEGQWVPLTRATFTADQTPTNNIDAGVEGPWFFLTTGGSTVNHTALKSTLSRTPLDVPLPE